MDIEQHYKDNYRNLCKRVSYGAGGFDCAEDIVQDAYEKAIRYLNSFDDKVKSFDTWFNTILGNCLRDFKNKEKMQGMSIPFDEKDEYLIPDEVDFTKKEVVNEIRKRIASKPEPLRNVLYLHYQLDYKPSDIYAVTELPRGTILSMLARFNREVKDYYKRGDE